MKTQFRFEPYQAFHIPLIKTFNKRLQDSGSQHGFYETVHASWPETIPRQFFALLEEKLEDKQVRGACGIRHQAWSIHGHVHSVRDLQGPVTEGIVNPAYATAAMRMFREALKLFPLLYGWGHGGPDEPIVKLYQAVGFTLLPSPYLFCVTNPGKVLEQNRFFSPDSKANLLGKWIGSNTQATHIFRSTSQALMWSQEKIRLRGLEITTQAAIGDWADTIYHAAKEDYPIHSIRDTEVLSTLYPMVHKTQEWNKPTLLLVKEHNLPIGWVSVIQKQTRNHHRYGDMTVGMIADGFCKKEHAPTVIAAAMQYLRAHVDLIFANQTHPDWQRAFKLCGFLSLANKRPLVVSPEFKKLIGDTPVFCTNMDGHGPML